MNFAKLVILEIVVQAGMVFFGIAFGVFSFLLGYKTCENSIFARYFFMRKRKFDHLKLMGPGTTWRDPREKERNR